MAEDQFYSNREIFEKLTSKIDDLTKELTKTQALVVRYNGIPERVSSIGEKVDDVCVRVKQIEAESVGKGKAVNTAVIALGVAGTLVGIAGGILTIATKL